MLKKNLFILMIFISSMMMSVYQDSKNIPVTNSIREVFIQISSGSYQKLIQLIKEQRPLLHKSVSEVQHLQQIAKELSNQSIITKQDMDAIKEIVEVMKEDIVLSMALKSFSYTSLQQPLCLLSYEAMIALDALTARHIDDDILDLKQMLVQAEESLKHDTLNAKVIVRMLSIINEIFQKHDELFVSAYDIIMLTHVALIIFFMGSL